MKMVQQVGVAASKADHLCLIHGTHMVEVENWLWRVPCVQQALTNRM